MNKKLQFLKFSLFGILAVAGIGVIVMLLWNWLMPTIFGLTTISFLQALGLFALGRIIFGGFGKRGHMWGHRENPIHKHWQKMSPEQRMKFLEKRRHFGMGGGHFFGGRHFFDNMPNEESEKRE